MSQADQNMQDFRMMFKYFNRFMMLMWRLGLGNWVNIWPDGMGRIMVLTQKGRKSGLPRRTPVNYAVVDGKVYCAVGFGDKTHWYKNVIANPNVEIWLPDGFLKPIAWYRGVAADVTGSEGYLPILRQVLINSGFVAEMAEYDPRNDTDEKLAELTKSYRLVCVDDLQPMTGNGGPGELAWLWPVGFFALLLILPILIFTGKRS